MKKVKQILIPLVSIIFIFSCSNVYALENLNDYKPNSTLEGSETFIEKAGLVLGFIRTAGILISVISLGLIGLKYMITSPAEKADYKKDMIPFIVGCFMLGGVSLVIGLIESISF